MKVKIYYVEVAPELEAKEFDLASVIKSKGECIVGRSPDCDLVLEGSDLSRQHGKFWIQDDYYYFSDTGSSNGSLFNGELAERNQEYLLNLGDTIRIGDFVLKMEPEDEIAATVFKVIDPALFRSRQPQIVDASQPEPAEISPVVPIVGLAGAAISMPMIVDRSIENIPDPVTTEPLPSALVEDEDEDEWDDDNSSDAQVEAVIAENPSVIVEDEEDDNEIDVEAQVAALDSIEDEEDDAAAATDVAISAQPPAALIIEDEDEDDDEEDEDENEELSDVVASVAQPSESVVEEDDDEIDVEAQVAALDSIEDEEDDDDDDAEVAATDAAMSEQPPAALMIEDDEEEDEELSDVVDSAAQPSESVVEEIEDEDDDEIDVEAQVAALDSIEEDDDAAIDAAISAQPPAALTIEDDEEDEELSDVVASAAQPSESVVEEDDDEIDVEAQVAALDSIESEEDNEDEDEEDVDKDKNLQIETSSVSADAPVAAIVAGISTNNKKIGAELLSQKQIVLIAHDAKVADLTDLVNQHKDFLATCLTISWASIADSLRQETGMVVSKELPSGAAGGFQTIAGLVNSGDVLAVIFLKDFFAQAQTGQANEEALLRLCNINEILLATNIATAESIVHYLQS